MSLPFRNILPALAVAFTAQIASADPFSQVIRQFTPRVPTVSPNDVKKMIEQSGSSTKITVQDGPRVGNGPTQPTPPADPNKLTPTDVRQGTPLEHAQQRTIDEFDPRIAGGVPANIGDFPWQVILIAGGTPDYIRSPFCGGSLVGYQWVVTAAHCMAGIADPKLVDIVSGSTFPRYQGEGDRVGVTQITVHPAFNADTYENDIAVLKLTRAVKLGESIKLPLPTLDIPPNSNATVSGWGAVVAYGAMTDRLLKADVPVVDNDTCNRDAYNGDVKIGMLCAGYREGGVDACQGDSGGPLMAKVSGVPTLIGVVSWGRGCALRLKYGVYTRVTSYAGWLKSATGIGPVANVGK
ncbi:serine protease [Bradyrhizobium genosp. L]|uniref:serine protease n=1 Tax=Bradyrhizobium genosp. L TaxID=83637 RepID=UPI0018A25589|nr:serine protease [Bradyrhizobium genosp. L]QPF82268.1 serine protease [Bradyrhizobium genosp. L]